ncbi:ABC transporter permease [Methylibium sp.]|uniref:ABC transporter permease n=1 Tax=Methylibium sp. TaxID=2067992 RepID=UPI0025F8F1D9|nr:ABC transporter permease [Methylibium sp.]
MAVTKSLSYALRRLSQAVPTVLVIIALNFLLLQLAPGDAADVLAGEAGSATPEFMAQLRKTFGLDQPMGVQLLLYMKQIVTFDLGYSFRHGMTVAELILSRLWPTLLLMVTVLALSVGMGVLLGSFAARKLNRWQDNLISMLTVLAYATPVFWAGLMLIVLFSIKLGWFPTSGMQQVAAFHEGAAKVRDIAHHLVLPAVTLTMFYLALYTRLMRASVLEQFSMDYVVTARAKGLTERQIARRHVLRNAVLPVLTMAGVQVGALLGGSVVVETVFAWPGLGLLAYESLFARDLNLLLGIFFVSTCLVIIVNLIVDVAYSLLDPRIDLR